MQGVVRNLQILLEQSKLWKGELAQLPSGPVRRRIFCRGAARGVHLSECNLAQGNGRDGLGKFYG
jgi:hypothetical protein